MAQFSNDWKGSVRVATTVSIDLTVVQSTIDNITLNTNDRILVWKQTNAAQNGIYKLGSNGKMTRATDFDQGKDISPGATVYVETGMTYAGCYFTQTTLGKVVVGTTLLTFEQKFSTGVGPEMDPKYTEESTPIAVSGSQTMVPNRVYMPINNDSQVTLTLPTTMAQGQWIEIRGIGLAGFKVVQVSGQQIRLKQVKFQPARYGVEDTPVGAGSGIQVSEQATVRLECITANTSFLTDIVTGNVSILAPAPVAPTGLTAAAAGNSILIEWTDASANEDGFRIQRHGPDEDWSEITTVGPDTASYLDSGLAPETAYAYRVCAYNAGGDSDFSNEASATTPAQDVKPVFHTDVQNGLPMVSFDGVDDTMYTRIHSSLTTNESVTILGVGRKHGEVQGSLWYGPMAIKTPPDVNTVPPAWDFGISSGGTWNGSEWTGESPSFDFSVKVDNYDFTTNRTDENVVKDAAILLASRYNGATNALDMLVNGVATTPRQNAPWVPAPEGPVRDALSCIQIGAWTTNCWNGSQFGMWDIGEIIVFTTAITDEQLTALNSHLLQKWGLGSGTPMTNEAILALDPKLWLKADAIVGSEGPITTWSDSSAYENHATTTMPTPPPPPAPAPRFMENGYSAGKPSVSFAGAGELLTINGNSGLSGDSITVVTLANLHNDIEGLTDWMLVRNPSSPDGSIVWGFGCIPSTNAEIVYLTTDSGGSTHIGSQCPREQWAKFSLRYDSAVGYTEFFINSGNVNPLLDPIPSGALVPSTGPLQLGGYNASFNYQEYATVEFAEIMLFNRKVTDQELLDLETYLEDKWNGAGSSFDPMTVSGLQVWLKADSLSLLQGQQVTLWEDSSGNDNDAHN